MSNFTHLVKMIISLIPIVLHKTFKGHNSTSEIVSIV